MSDLIYHIAFRVHWKAAIAAGEYRPPSLADEGFIHACGDEAQMLRTAGRLFPDRTDLLALDIEVARLPAASPVLREPARSGEIYPHVYGPVNLAAVVRIRALPPDATAPHGFRLGPGPA